MTDYRFCATRRANTAQSIKQTIVSTRLSDIAVLDPHGNGLLKPSCCASCLKLLNNCSLRSCICKSHRSRQLVPESSSRSTRIPHQPIIHSFSSPCWSFPRAADDWLEAGPCCPSAGTGPLRHYGHLTHRPETFALVAAQPSRPVVLGPGEIDTVAIAVEAKKWPGLG